MTDAPTDGPLPPGVQLVDAATTGGDHMAAAHSGMWAEHLDDQAERLLVVKPAPGPYSLRDATAVLTFAEACVAVAADIITAGDTTADRIVQPSQVGQLAAALGTIAEATQVVVDRLNRHLSIMHRQSLDGRIVVPPGGTAHAEVERLIKSMIEVEQNAASMAAHCSTTLARTTRLSVVSPVVAEIADKP